MEYDDYVNLKYNEWLVSNVSASFIFQCYCVLTEVLIYSYFAIDKIQGFWPLVGGLTLSAISVYLVQIVFQVLAMNGYIRPLIYLKYLIVGTTARTMAGVVTVFLPEDDMPYDYYKTAISMYFMRIIYSFTVIYFVVELLT